jgi:hypothetical protein
MTDNRNFIILSTLSQFANDEKICCVSYREIVKRSGYCKTVVLQSIRELTLMGKIVKYPSHLGKNRYRIVD